MKKEHTYIFDACSLIALLKGEEGSKKVCYLLEQCEKKYAIGYIHMVNVYEVYYDYLRTLGNAGADEILNDVLKLALKFIEPINQTLIEKAGYFKSNFKLSLADSIMLGLAELKGATVVSSDHHEFDFVEADTKLKFYWIR